MQITDDEAKWVHLALMLLRLKFPTVSLVLAIILAPALAAVTCLSATTFVLCVGFDLLFPAYAMYQAW